MIQTDLAHASVTVTDIDRATAFYTAAFGFEPAFEARGLSGQIAAMTNLTGLTCDLAQLRHPRSGAVVELVAFRPRPTQDATPPAAHLAFTVAELVAAEAHVLGLGARRLGAIVAFAEGRAAYYREPAGSVFELEEAAP